MAAQQHCIRRLVLEIRAAGEDAATEIHRRSGQMQRHWLEPIIDECCSELSSPDRLHRIDKLEVNLGSVTLAGLETELPRALQKGMREALREQIQAMDRRAGEGHPATRSQLELVAFFAMHGALPWWADSRRPRLLGESVAFLLRHAPDDLASLLGAILNRPESALRIVLHCDDDLLSRLFGMLSSPAPEVVAQQLNSVLRGLLCESSPNFSRARNALWIAVLTHASSAAALSRSQSASTPSPFWLRVFDSVSTRSIEIFAALFAAVPQHARSTDPLAGRTIVPVIAALVEVGRRHGGISKAALGEIEDLLRAAESKADDSDAALRRDDLVLGVDEDEARELKTTQSVLESARRQVANDGRTHPTRQAKLHENQPQAEPVPPPGLTDRRTSQDSRPLDLRFADADSVYIENSGLVILWPFLERFFDRLQLLRERNFVDITARHRAAGLLQYLVTEDPSPPEYQMLLNKMLCGLEPEDLLDIGPAVTEVETEECASLLSAVIENAPVLRNMSQGGFRGSFLLRNGALSAGPGNWLLRVERETFDIVLDRFPWNFSWIKLPWMDVPLAVEW